MTREIPEPPGIEVIADRREDQTILKVIGEIDIATVEQFEAAAREHLEQAPVLFDMCETDFMDSTGVRALDALLQEAEVKGWKFAIGSDIHRNVRHVLELTGVLDSIPLQERPDAAGNGG